MGDRVLFQVVGTPTKYEKKGEFSPVAYGHWFGDSTPEICQKLRRLMQERCNDVSYTYARLLGILCAYQPDDDSGVGGWNAERVLEKRDSHGDAGVVLIHLDDKGMRFECMGGYLECEDSHTALPTVSRDY